VGYQGDLEDLDSKGRKGTVKKEVGLTHLHDWEVTKK
jgi:hypothetical protein